MHAILIQGDSVRMTWGIEEKIERERRPIRRDAPASRYVNEPTCDVLNLRLGEELDYARRMLDAMGDELSGDPMAIGRHGVVLQSLDIVGQMLGHIASVIRASDPKSAVEAIGMCDLKARLSRSGAL